MTTSATVASTPSRTSGGPHPVALVTGANHGIGAATAHELAARGARVCVTGLALDEPREPSTPAAYYEARSHSPESVAAAIREAGGSAVAVEIDLRDDAAPASLFDTAEAAFGAPVRILIHSASGWVGDSFTGAASDHIGRELTPVSVATHVHQFAVDARAGGLLITEFARRHLTRSDDWGRIVSLTSDGPAGFPGEASYGAAKAALDSYTMTAAAELGAVGVTANSLMPPVTDTGWVTDAVRKFVRDSWRTTMWRAPRMSPRRSPGCAPTMPGWSPATASCCGEEGGPASRHSDPAGRRPTNRPVMMGSRPASMRRSCLPAQGTRACAIPLSDEELRMDLLGLVWWGSAVGGFASVAVAVTTPSRRRAALLVASLLFLVSGVLGILSIGIIFIVAAIVCAVAAVRSAGTDGRGRALTAD